MGRTSLTVGRKVGGTGLYSFETESASQHQETPGLSPLSSYSPQGPKHTLPVPEAPQMGRDESFANSGPLLQSALSPEFKVKSDEDILRTLGEISQKIKSGELKPNAEDTKALKEIEFEIEVLGERTVMGLSEVADDLRGKLTNYEQGMYAQRAEAEAEVPSLLQTVLSANFSAPSTETIKHMEDLARAINLGDMHPSDDEVVMLRNALPPITREKSLSAFNQANINLRRKLYDGMTVGRGVAVGLYEVPAIDQFLSPQFVENSEFAKRVIMNTTRAIDTGRLQPTGEALAVLTNRPAVPPDSPLSEADQQLSEAIAFYEQHPDKTRLAPPKPSEVQDSAGDEGIPIYDDHFASPSTIRIAIPLYRGNIAEDVAQLSDAQRLKYFKNHADKLSAFGSRIDNISRDELMKLRLQAELVTTGKLGPTWAGKLAGTPAAKTAIEGDRLLSQIERLR